jgi:glycerol uptake facilitator-like aquaporin
MASPVKRTSLKDSQISRQVAPPPPQPFNARLFLRHCYPHESIDDLQNPVFYRDVFIETILCGIVECCVIWALTTLNKAMYIPSTTHFGLFAGFFIYVLIEGYGPVSGAPMNPAGVWGFFLAGRMSAARMVLYTGGEIGGAAAGAMIGWALTPHGNITVPTLMQGPGLTASQGMCIEAILTFNLLFVALSVTNPRGKMAIMPSLPIAFAIGTGIMAAGTHTGGLQNPIVPFGPAVVNQNFTNHWLYWVGPYIGATVAAIIYQICTFMKDHCEHHITNDDTNVGLQNPVHEVDRHDDGSNL